MKNTIHHFQDFVFIFVLIAVILWAIFLGKSCKGDGFGPKEISKDTIYTQDSVIFNCVHCNWENVQYLHVFDKKLILDEKK